MPAYAVDEFQKRINQIKVQNGVLFFLFVRCFMSSLQSDASNKIVYFISTPAPANVKTDLEIELRCS